MVFYLFWGNGNIVIGNGNNEQAYYDSYITGKKITNLIDFQNWISDWVNHTTLEEQDKINHYKLSRNKYQEGDYFRFSLDRNLYGYGRILLDIRKRQKQGYYYWNIIMGRPIIIEVFHIITERKNVSIAELKRLKTFPSQYIFENVIYYGEYEIISHGKLPDFIAYPIMYGKSISMNENNICFQCGLIYKQIPIVDSKSIVGDFKNNGVGFNIHNDLVTMRKCISINSNLPYWEKYCNDLDLRNPKYHDELVKVLQQFDLLYLLDLYQDCQ